MEDKIIHDKVDNIIHGLNVWASELPNCDPQN